MMLIRLIGNEKRNYGRAELKMTNFQWAVQFLVDKSDGFDAEGGYVNDPVDPGGETKYGISKRANPEVDIKNLTLDGAIAIYKRKYWDRYQLDPVPLPLCIVLLDSFVQHNPKKVLEWQKNTQDYKEIIRIRREYYLRIIQNKPAQIRFKNGWMNRLNELSKYCDIVMSQQ